MRRLNIVQQNEMFVHGLAASANRQRNKTTGQQNKTQLLKFALKISHLMIGIHESLFQSLYLFVSNAQARQIQDGDSLFSAHELIKYSKKSPDWLRHHSLAPERKHSEDCIDIVGAKCEKKQERYCQQNVQKALLPHQTIWRC